MIIVSLGLGLLILLFYFMCVHMLFISTYLYLTCSVLFLFNPGIGYS